MRYTGSCHCGKVAFEVEGELKEVIDCNLSWSGASAKLTKMVTVYDILVVCFDGTGVIIFNLPDLRKITGRIQSQCRVSHMEGDHDGNLLIVEEFSPQQNCISVYKVKK